MDRNWSKVVVRLFGECIVVVENKKKSLDAEQHEETRPEGINERQDSRMLYNFFYNVVYFENPRI